MMVFAPFETFVTGPPGTFAFGTTPTPPGGGRPDEAAGHVIPRCGFDRAYKGSLACEQVRARQQATSYVHPITVRDDHAVAVVSIFDVNGLHQGSAGND